MITGVWSLSMIIMVILSCLALTCLLLSLSWLNLSWLFLSCLGLFCPVFVSFLSCLVGVLSYIVLTLRAEKETARYSCRWTWSREGHSVLSHLVLSCFALCWTWTCLVLPTYSFRFFSFRFVSSCLISYRHVLSYLVCYFWVWHRSSHLHGLGAGGSSDV